MIEIVRDLADIAGDVDTTGLGFTPRKLIVVAAISTTLVSSIGFSDVDGHGACVFRNYLGNQDAAANLVFIAAGAAGASQFVSGVAYTADGFTLTWSKNGAPTGNVTLKILASS